VLRVYALLCCLSTLFSGCATHQQYETALSYGRIVAGSRITLHQELVIPANQVRLFLQRGQVLTNNFDQYYPHCNFEIRTLSDHAWSIVPDEFLVTRVRQGFEEVVSLKPIKVAALGATALYYAVYPMVSRYIHLYLASERQPDVMRLTCHGAFDELPDADLPTVDEIGEALGGLATLQRYPKPGVIK